MLIILLILIKFSRFVDHIKYICNYQDNVTEYIINWLAHIIQNPTRKTETAIVFYSYLEGIGKNAFTDIVTKLFDSYVGKGTNMLLGVPNRTILYTRILHTIIHL